MCRPDNLPDREGNSPRNVTIAGAGPAGLLLTALLIQRNNELPSPLYNVTLVDPRIDFGNVSEEELKGRFRSWMLGLAGHGCNALREVDGLYDDYCKQVGIQLQALSIHMGSKELKVPAGPSMVDADGNLIEDVLDNFIVDRNFIVAAIARYVKDMKEKANNADYLTTLYEAKVMYVDHDQRRVLVRDNKTGAERYMPYDLLVGCDGVRSVVRESLIKRHSTFECDIGDIFQHFKQVHVQRPKSVEESSMHVLPACMISSIQGIALPETGDMLNIGMGAPRHLFDKLPEELKSSDPKVVAEFVKENFKAFEMVDYDDFAQQRVDQPWRRTGQVHCNFFHSTDINVVIMGDAAHATSPSIGMGMNQALRDAQCFYKLLQEHKDDFSQVLPEFSKMRVRSCHAFVLHGHGNPNHGDPAYGRTWCLAQYVP